MEPATDVPPKNLPETPYGLWIIYATIHNRALFGFNGASSKTEVMLAKNQFDLIKIGRARYLQFDNYLQEIQSTHGKSGELFLNGIWNMIGIDPNLVLAGEYGFSDPHLIMYFNHNGADSAGNYGYDLPFNTDQTYIKNVQISTHSSVKDGLKKQQNYIIIYRYLLEH